MKSKKLAIFLSTVLLVNSVGLSALAEDSKTVDESLIDQSLTAQSNEMKRSLDQVNALIKSMEDYKTKSAGEKQGAFVNAARLMITLLGLSSTAVHMKNRQAESSIELTLAAVSGILSTLLEKYVSSQKIDMDQIKALLLSNQAELSKSLGSATSRQDAELIAGAVTQIGQLNGELDNKMGDIKRSIDGGQMDMAIISIATLALNYAAPLLPQRIKSAVSNKAPTLLGQAAKTKKQSMQAMGATNIATLLSTLAGLGGASSQAQLDKILSNLYVARANLIKETGVK